MSELLGSDRTMKLFKFVLFLFALVSPTTLWGHSGGLNSDGCHNNRKTGNYHCHRKQPPATELKSTIKKSRSGICHAPGTTYYARTLNYTEYDSMKKCLASGGRKPKR